MHASIRNALSADSARIAQLCGQLGYEVAQSHVERFLSVADSSQALLVAVVPRVGVVGWVGVSTREALLSSRRADIDGFVVEDEYRGQGIGAQLLAAAEEWARRRNCIDLRVRTNVVRERAHAFYARQGYTVLKTQRIFLKQL